jgi:hypothetical protein
VLWIFAGIGLAMLVVHLGELSDGPSAEQPSSSAATAPVPLAPTTTQQRFAALYLQYLTQSYYAPSQGFCRPLLDKICMALVHAKLLAGPSDCRVLPNSAFILAVGQFQLGVGLPVDGKAGPGTVRLLLGGSFNNLASMSQAFCTPKFPDGGAPEVEPAP